MRACSGGAGKSSGNGVFVTVFSCPRLLGGVLWGSEATTQRNALGITRISMGLCDAVTLQSLIACARPALRVGLHALPQVMQPRTA